MYKLTGTFSNNKLDTVVMTNNIYLCHTRYVHLSTYLDNTTGTVHVKFHDNYRMEGVTYTLQAPFMGNESSYKYSQFEIETV